MARPRRNVNEARLNGNTDAMEWAEEFCAAFVVVGRPGCAVDDSDNVGLMVGWFANAIETGRSAGFREGQQAPRPTGGCTVTEL